MTSLAGADVCGDSLLHGICFTVVAWHICPQQGGSIPQQAEGRDVFNQNRKSDVADSRLSSKHVYFPYGLSKFH